MADLASGLATLLTPGNLLLLALGVTIGMIIGVMPGLGPSAGIAILLPLTFDLDPIGAIAMLAAIYYGAMYGGTITSVLINTPGESASVATTFDGYPLARQGRAGPALVLCAVGSFVAGTLGTLAISVMAPPFARIARTFGPAELLLVVAIGLMTLVIIVGEDKVKGIASALIGFALATSGVDLGTGASRFTFGSADLISGVNFIPIAIGLFGVGELLHGVFEGQHRAAYRFASLSAKSARFWPTGRDWLQSRWAILRGSAVGFLIGIVPGAGATIASLMSYSMEKSISKTPEEFGKGSIPGLVGPESANNAATSGAMIPLLTLGVPGSAATAVLLGAFVLYGLRPGPLLMADNPEFAWGLIASMFLGNVMLVAINVFTIPVFASFMKVPFRVVVPVIAVLCSIGTYAVSGSAVEVWLMAGFGIVGLFMKLYGYSPAATVIALVLGALAETSLRQTLIITRGDPLWVLRRPSSAVLVVILVMLILTPLLARLWRARGGRGGAGEGDVPADEVEPRHDPEQVRGG